MKKSELLINSVFKLNRKDLLHEVNYSLIDKYEELELLKCSRDLINEGKDPSPENFYTWHNKQGYKNKKVWDLFQEIIKQDPPPHPDIHKEIKEEYNDDAIDSFIRSVEDHFTTQEIKMDSLIKLYQKVIKNAEIKKVHSMKEMTKDYLDKLESGEEDKYLKSSIEIRMSKIKKIMGSNYIFPRIHTILGLPGRYKTSILINILD